LLKIKFAAFGMFCGFRESKDGKEYPSQTKPFADKSGVRSFS